MSRVEVLRERVQEANTQIGFAVKRLEDIETRHGQSFHHGGQRSEHNRALKGLDRTRDRLSKTKQSLEEYLKQYPYEHGIGKAESKTISRDSA